MLLCIYFRYIYFYFHFSLWFLILTNLYIVKFTQCPGLALSRGRRETAQPAVSQRPANFSLQLERGVPTQVPPGTPGRVNANCWRQKRKRVGLMDYVKARHLGNVCILAWRKHEALWCWRIEATALFEQEQPAIAKALGAVK